MSDNKSFSSKYSIPSNAAAAATAPSNLRRELENSIRIQLQADLGRDEGNSMDLVRATTSLLPDRNEFRRQPSIDLVKEGRRMIQSFLHENSCYQLIKNSSKVVVFDIKIPVNLAFFALVEHDIKSAPLWDSDQACFVGMLTASDFVNILRHYYIRGSPMTELAEHSIASWRAVPSSMSMVHQPNTMVSVTPESSLYDAAKALQKHHLHRVPVLDPTQNSVLAIVTYRGILEYLVTSFREQRRLFDQGVRELGIGTYQNIVTVPEDTPLISVLHTLVEHRISAVPVVDANDAVLDVYSVADVTDLAKDEAVGKLDLPVGEILRTQVAEGIRSEVLHTCNVDDTLHMLFEKFAAVKAHRLIVTDPFNRCIGIISLSDLFQHFVEDERT